jgi:hypothetical protein
MARHLKSVSALRLEKIVCRTPGPGKKTKRIERWKFDAVRAAILATLPRRGDGMRFLDLAPEVQRLLKPELRTKLGSVSWYTTTVKLAMEVRGEIARVPGTSPQRLLRA